MALLEKALPFQAVFFEHGRRPPELEALGPYAKSPTVFDGDISVWDSQIVLEYLEDRYPQSPLLPGAPARRAEARMLAARVARELEPSMNTVEKQTVLNPMNHKAKDEAKVAQAKREFLDALSDWERLLQPASQDQRFDRRFGPQFDRGFLGGEVPGLADITLFSVFPPMRALAGTEIPSACPQLQAWFERMAARPAARQLRRGSP